MFRVKANRWKPIQALSEVASRFTVGLPCCFGGGGWVVTQSTSSDHVVMAIMAIV